MRICMRGRYRASPLLYSYKGGSENHCTLRRHFQQRCPQQSAVVVYPHCRRRRHRTCTSRHERKGSHIAGSRRCSTQPATTAAAAATRYSQRQMHTGDYQARGRGRGLQSGRGFGRGRGMPPGVQGHQGHGPQALASVVWSPARPRFVHKTHAELAREAMPHLQEEIQETKKSKKSPVRTG
eukprot:COSAG01_NODE_258_length_20077_cov_124.162429_31_plen_181_part_00